MDISVLVEWTLHMNHDHLASILIINLVTN